MNKIIKMTAAVLVAGTVITFAGCASKTVNTAITSSNWFTGTTYKGIQPSFIEGSDDFSKEEILYDVTYDGNGSNPTYSVEYKDGTFVTQFYAKEYDWSASDVPEAYRMSLKETAYYYRTELNISVRYTFTADGSQSEWFNDRIISECYFRSAQNNLQPIYSKQIFKTASPAVLKATSLENAYKSVDVTYESYFNNNLTEIASKNSDSGNAFKVYSLKKLKNSIFDNSALIIAARSMRINTENFTQAISLFSAAADSVSAYTLAKTDVTIDSDELKAISSVMKENGLFTQGTADGESTLDNLIATTAVTIVYTGGRLTGSSPVMWFADITDPDNNTARTTLLKIYSPLDFGLGSLNYSLKDINSTIQG